ncbi:MAG: FAD:protein FMN transferase [Planctomycetota bacterium]
MPAADGVKAPLLALALSSALPALAQEPELELVERRLGVMGTDLQLTVLGEDRASLEETLDLAEAELRRVEDVFTSWRDSELTRLNAAAGQGPFAVSREQCELIARALKVSELTDGAFDITFASVGKLWDFKADPPTIPSPEAVAAALEHVGWQKVQVDLEHGTVSLPAGTRIGLGGMAKGYGVDRAMAVLLKRGIRHGLVNAGGDLKALGRKRGKPWEIAIKHPRDRERVLAVIPVSNACVVTSGDYERFVEYEGKRYHHILDPRTGYPSTGCMSATVVAPEAALADALATALCVLGPERGLELIERLPRIEALVVGLDGEVRTSSGLPRGSAR